jgi:hypothetical protein
MAAPASARLEAVAPFGPPVFVFVSRDRDATLLLPRDRRVLEHGRPQAVLEAVTGVPLDAAELRLTLTACPIGPRAGEAKQFGDEWRIVPDEAGAVYLHREPRGGPWRVVVAVHGSTSASMWRAEYAEYQRAGPIGGLPSIVRLISADAKRFDLRLALSQIEVNTALDADAFRVQVPRDALPITLEELQQSGPLGR